MSKSDTSAAKRTLHRRKITAVLAGGMVLGVGAAVTLAAWNDSEFATGSFAAGSFTFQGSTDGTAFSDNPLSPGATLAFESNADNLAPNAVVYDAYFLKVTGNPATVTAATPVYTGDLSAAKLGAVVKQVPVGGLCNATTFAASTDVVTSTPFNMVVGTNVQLCMQVTAGATLTQNDTGTITWQWDAESTV